MNPRGDKRNPYSSFPDADAAEPATQRQQGSDTASKTSRRSRREIWRVQETRPWAEKGSPEQHERSVISEAFFGNRAGPWEESVWVKQEAEMKTGPPPGK